MVDRLFADLYLASLYDAWCPRSTRDDYDFYLPRIMAAGSVLDVGCGTGTLLAEARDAGHAGRLCGLDPAEGMLAQARRRSDIEWVLGELRSATWAVEFDLIIMTGHAFQAIVEDDDLLTSLSAVGRALTPSGRFAFETRNPMARAWEAWTAENETIIVGPDGGRVRVAREVVVPFDGHTVSFTHTFSGDHPSLPQVSRSTLRFLGAEALDDLLARAGLVVEERYGDFTGGPLTDASPEIVTIARTA